MHFLTLLLVAVLALFAAISHTASTKATQNHARRAPQYYCSHVYQQTHVFHTSYIIKGRGSPIHEPMLREAVESTPLCLITEWYHEEGENKDGTNDFDLIFDFNLGCQARLEKKLRELLGEDIDCPKVSWKKHEKLDVGLHDDLGVYSDLEKPMKIGGRSD